VSQGLLAATIARYWSREHGTFVNNLPWLGEEKKLSLCDRSLATAILFDQCPEGDTRAAVQALADCPREMGLSYPANAGWRLWALAKAGRAGVIVRDLRDRWATMDSVKENNTLQEGWKTRPDGGYQWSHCAVAPLYIAHQGLAGIRPLLPGYQRVEVRPQLADLEHLELVTYTPRGPLHFSSKGRLGNREIAIELPPGTQGELVVSREENMSLQPATGEAPAGHLRYILPAGRRTELRLQFS
jgi:alpha-L-rhamnosidase